ncbi:DUF771 domain-containing protein [Streptococcus hyovaginalis]|nr:DUF771 domain-containing protein [Streptococcus hyovaginalis]
MTHFTIDLTNITIELPEHQIIIAKEEYDTLKRQSLSGKYYSLTEVLDLLSVSRPWLLSQVLLNPTIRKDIDIDKNPKGFVKYPKNQGGRYYFLATRTRDYFEHHFSDILKKL